MTDYTHIPVMYRDGAAGLHPTRVYTAHVNNWEES